MSSNIVSADFKVGSTANGTETTIASILGTALNIKSGTNTIEIYSDGDSNANLVKFNVGANVATYMASGKTTINGGTIEAGSTIKIGNTDGCSDYCSITKGDIDFYKYFPTIGHKPTKSLKRLEIGTAKSGEEKELPGYWAHEPRIFVSPLSIQTYIKDASAQNQVLNCPQPTPYKKSEGKWAFVPQIMLIASALSGLGNIMPINYTDRIIDSADWAGNVGTVTGTEYTVTESNIVGMRVQVDLRGVFICKVPGEPDKYRIYNVRFYVRIGFYIQNTWSSTDWTLIETGTESHDVWNWKSHYINIPEQANEISKIRVEIKPYAEPAQECWYAGGSYSTTNWGLGTGTTGEYGGALSVESTLVNYAGTYGSDSVTIEGDVNFIAISEG